MFQTFLNILGVIGIVVVASFVIVFLSDLFISIVDGTNGIFFRRNKKKNVQTYQQEIVKRPVLLNKPKEIEPQLKLESEERSFEKQFEEKNIFLDDEEPKEVDLELARREEELARQASGRQSIVDQRLQSQKTAPATSFQPKLEPFEAKKPENIIVTPIPQQQKIEKETEEDIDSIISEISKQTLKELENSETKEEKFSSKQVDSAVENDILKRQAELEKEIEKLRVQIEEDKATIKSLEEKLKTDTNKTSIDKKAPIGSKKELEERLEVLRLRLKENEKELSSNRKEFVPLRRVNLTLDKDKKKLRRREAIVAKQKVLLYGVNNYTDIDEEKAKKLSEELDLLEGLRLSVQHCEDVMQKNKERYPILERANNFLMKSSSQLKEDISRLEKQIKNFDSDD